MRDTCYRNLNKSSCIQVSKCLAPRVDLEGLLAQAAQSLNILIFHHTRFEFEQRIFLDYFLHADLLKGQLKGRWDWKHILGDRSCRSTSSLDLCLIEFQIHDHLGRSQRVDPFSCAICLSCIEL